MAIGSNCRPQTTLPAETLNPVLSRLIWTGRRDLALLTLLQFLQIALVDL